MPSHNGEEAKIVMRNLMWLEHLIFSQDKNSKLVKTGDFNKDHLPVKLEENYGLKPVVTEGVAIHVLKRQNDLVDGSQLD